MKMTKSKIALFLSTVYLASCSTANVEEGNKTTLEKTPQTSMLTNDSANVGLCTTALSAAEIQLDDFRKTYTDPTKIPRSFEHNKTSLVDPSNWTSGFIAGNFWYMYEFTKDESWKNTALRWTAELEDQKNNTGTHDLGFMMYNSFGNGLRLANIPNYESILVKTADSLLSRYSATVGATRSWDMEGWSFPVIIDNMMNLELLYFASQATNNSKYADAATTHAETTMKNHFREDYSSYHVVDYDPKNGEVLHKQTHQGIADDSAWARGQAWGLYGYAMVYRFTQDKKFLTLAQNIADFYLNHPNLPKDKVPYFDFDVPGYPDIENYRDSSAASVAASGLLELASYVSEPQASTYKSAALAMLASLASAEYSAKKDENGHFLLKHGTGRWQANHEVDAAINYGDYYYLEALNRCTKLNN